MLERHEPVWEDQEHKWRAGAGSANKGWEAAMAAVEMATLQKHIRQVAPPGIKV